MAQDLTFTITAAQRKKIAAWVKDHGQAAPCTTLNGLLVYMFTPCGIGVSVVVCCPCGAKLDLTDASSW